MTGAALAVAAAALATAAPLRADSSFSLVSAEGPVTVGGAPVRPGGALRPGGEFTVQGVAVLKNASHVLRVRGPAVVAVARGPNPTLSFASGSLLAVRLKPGRRLHLQTPAAGLDLGYAEAYVEPRPAGTYLCICDAGERGSRDRHHAVLWSARGITPAAGLEGHSDEELRRLRTPQTQRRRR